MGWPNLPLRRRTAPAIVNTTVTLEDGGVERSRSVGGELGRFFKDIRAAPDRGKSFYQAERNRQHLASLVEAGRHAGRSRVQYTGRNITYHLFTKDFFISVINQKTSTILTVTAVVYLFVFFFFSIWWYLIVRFYPGCLYGATTYVEAFTFAVVTHMTIGYGNTGPQQCWAAAWVLVTQTIVAVLLEAIVIGIVFARISHPKQRSRSIFISDSSIIARRDGILKFMFRVADVRRTQVVDPKIKAFMYTWGEGRVTAEGERIPVRCEQLDIGYIDGMLLLPLIIEHTIDERSPLCGHTHDSLMALNSEIVVTFEGTTEFGNPFMARRSYLPTEVHWGHQFAQIMMKPDGDDTSYHIDLNKFHDVVPQDGLPMLPPSALSQLVVNRAKRTVPYPLLGENTLVLSDVCVISTDEDGVPCLMCRAADTYPNQMLEIFVRMYLYRWHKPATPGGPVYSQISLECGYDTGEDRLYLRLPVEVTHRITDDSPIAHWLNPGGMMEDADSEIVVVINGYLHVTGQNRLRQRTYSVHNHVKYGYRFKNIVKHPAESRDRKPRVRWAHFHDIEPLPEALLGDGPGQLPPRQEIGLQPVASAPSLAGMYAKLPSMAPESHGALRSVEQRQHMWSQSDSTELTHGNTASSSGEQPTGSTSRPAPGAGPSRQLGTIWQGVPDAGTGSSVPSTAAGAAAGAAAGMVAGARMYQPSAEEARNDYTVLPIDLSRYAATAGNEGDSIPLPPPARRSPLPTSFSRQLSAARQHQEEVEAGKAAPFLLFPEVASYALETTDAGESLPHPQALHPTLPREWVDINERSDFTVMPMDLSRYVAQVSRSETLSRREGPVTLGEASELMAEAAQTMAAAAQQAQQPQEAQQGTPSPAQAQQPAAAGLGRPLGKMGPRRPSLTDIKAAVEEATAAEAAGQQPSRGTTDASGFLTPASALGGSPGAAVGASLPGSAAVSPMAGPSAGQAAAAAALAASAALAAAEQEEEAEEPQQQQQQQQEERQQPQPQPQPQPLRMQRPPRPPPAGLQGGADGQGSGSGRLAAAAAAAAVGQQEQQQVQESQKQQQQQEEEEGEGEGHWSAGHSSSIVGRTSSPPQQLPEQQQQGRHLGEQELEQLEQRLSRATSSWAIHEQEPESDEEKEGAGPIHFAKQESWQRERALKNLFAPGSPEKEPGASDGSGGAGSGGGGAGDGGGSGGGSPEATEQQ